MIPSLLLAQNNNQSDQKVIKINGVRGVFVPDSLYRTFIVDQRKGFTYFTNWKITEVQLIKSDSIISGLRFENNSVNNNWQLEKENYNDQVEVNQTLENLNSDLNKSNKKLTKKVRLIPYVGVGSFIAGAIVGLSTK